MGSSEDEMPIAERFLIVVPALAASVSGFGAGSSGAAYSDEQARRGQAIYAARCQSCHGESQEGGDEAPPLKGEGFWSEWEHGTARALYSRIISTMPPDSAGSLAPADVVNLVECLMKANDLPSGGKAVNSPDELNDLGLGKPE
jgi:mono/diheme cytochrome c family protein